jgi:hypothetical protein
MHSLALVEGGSVYSWGVNDEGALGREARGGELALVQGETAGNETIPERVMMPRKHLCVLVFVYSKKAGMLLLFCESGDELNVCMYGMHAYTYVSVYPCMYVRMYVCIHACMHVCMHACM